MKAVFADTFYWAALTVIEDPAHARALELSRRLAPEWVVTTDEVLAEYLTFFAGARRNIRERAGGIVAELMDSLEVRIVPQSRESDPCSGIPAKIQKFRGSIRIFPEAAR